MRSLISLLVLLPLILISGGLANDGRSTGQKSAGLEFPSGDWTFSAHPYMGEGYRLRPVVVTSVTSEVPTLSVTAVRIANISTKTAIAVKLGWTLYDEKSERKLLRKGETSLTAIDHGLASGSNTVLRLPVVSFMEIHTKLLKKGRLEGKYRLEVGATQVLFEDRSSWQVGQSVSVRAEAEQGFVKVAFRANAALSVTPLSVPLACPKQKCEYVAQSPPYYTCGASQNDEFCTNCVTNCCNSICGTEPVCDCN